MNGKIIGQERLEQLYVANFKVHPAYQNPNKSINKKEIAWAVGLNFEILSVEEQWTKVLFVATLSLHKTTDKSVIAKIQVQSVYRITAKLSFADKSEIVNRKLTALVYQTQGAWKAKNNSNLAEIIPQGINGMEEIKLGLQKQIYEKWV